jgi:propanediol utilization protein
MVRISTEASLDLHIDTDEGNAFNIKKWEKWIILQEDEILNYIKKHNII